MKYRLLILTLLCGFMWSLRAQGDLTPKDSATIDATQENLEIFARYEIRLMDSLLNVWYIQRDLASQNSVLSKLTDDTTKYDKIGRSTRLNSSHL